mgnify:CR=1
MLTLLLHYDIIILVLLPPRRWDYEVAFGLLSSYKNIVYSLEEYIYQSKY